MSSPSTTHAGASDLGEVLTSRGGGPLGRVTSVLFGAFLLLMGFGIASAGFNLLRMLGTPQGSVGGAILALGAGSLLLWGGWACVRSGLSTWHFHEFGATRTMLGRVVHSQRYDQVDAMTYSVTRTYLNGIYTGTDAQLVLEGPRVGGKKGTRLAYSGKHKEKPDGVLSRTFLKKNFKGEDELDAIKNIIALAIVQRWLAQGEFREQWCNGFFLTPRGLEYGGGPKKGTIIPYAKIKGLGGRSEGSVGPQSKYDYHQLFVEGEERGYILIQLIGRNFWPGMVLREMMRNESEAQAQA
jgi:hypothetical protein